MPFFQEIPLLPDDPIFKLPLLFAADSRAQKVNLGIGVYQDEAGKAVLLSCVQKAEELLTAKHLGKNYLPIDGDGDFIAETVRLIFGKDSKAAAEKRLFAVQTVGGAGALRLGAEFLLTLVAKKIYLSDPSWINHKNIFRRTGLEVGAYAYFNYSDHRLDFPALAAAIQAMPRGSIILLHGCGHNPTGVDPSPEQWRELSALIKKQGVIPFFDLAYQGFGDGLDEDAAAVRLFAEEGHEMLVAYSYSKNMGLYGERVGALALVAATPEAAQHAASQTRQMIRGVYSTPPLQGGRLAAAVLKDQSLRQEWLQELQGMRERLNKRRSDLARLLQEGSRGTDFSFLNRQRGMFSFCGLTAAHVQQLIDEYAIFLPADGRINVAGLNAGNLDYVSRAILKTMNA